MNTIKHYLIKFRRARSLETLNRQADLADERNPDDHKAINEAWNQRYLELTSRVDRFEEKI